MIPPIRRCAVIGNPISHSQSPEIHLSFAKQFDLPLSYDKVLVDPNDLKLFVRGFFDQGGTGLNVTLPFKQQVIKCAHELSQEATICQSVNTLSVNEEGHIRGDTTDGRGLLLDLKRLNFDLENKSILVVGAGGAAISIIYRLLKAKANLFLTNRTHEKLPTILRQFKPITDDTNNGTLAMYDKNDDRQYDGVISSISEFNYELMSPIINQLAKSAFVYDLNYGERAQDLEVFCEQQGQKRYSSGYGMLLAQAASSFEIWHGKLPTIE